MTNLVDIRAGVQHHSLRGRRLESELLDGVLASVRAGHSRALVLRGAAGVGKTALLDYLAEHAGDSRVVRAAGITSETELAFAGLQRLCAPMLDRLDLLPAPQRKALETAFGLSDDEAPNRFLIGLAVLRLLEDLARQRPLLCLVDDLQDLDRATVQTLAFVARRLSPRPVALVFAARGTDEERDLAGLTELEIRGLPDEDARALLDSVVTGPLDERVRDRIVAETRGNPLALLELARRMPPADLAGGFGLLDVPAPLEESFRRRLRALPAATRRLLVLAAAEPVGDPVVVWRAATDLGIGVDAAAPAAAAGFVEFGGNVLFHHPLVRSAVYHAAPPEERMSAHRALADATNADFDPDGRAWHRAHATAGLDEDVAAELERSTCRARARGGLAAAAAFLQRAATLTPDPGRRARRALAAAQSKSLAGAPEAASRLLALAQAGPLDELDRARAELLQARIAFASSYGRDAPRLLLEAAKRLESLDAALARKTYLDAFFAALFAGRFAETGGVRDIAEAVLAAEWVDPPGRPSHAYELLLDGLAVQAIRGYAAGAPLLKRALEAVRAERCSEEDALHWLWVACHVARTLGDDDAWDELTRRLLELVRESGAVSLLPIALNERLRVELLSGNLAAARGLVAEADATIQASGSHARSHGPFSLAAWAGDADGSLELLDRARNDAARRGEAMWLISAEWTRAELLNSLGRWDEALSAAESVAEQPDELGSSTWVSVELVEAAARSGDAERAATALDPVAELARASGTDWALGVEACSRALLSDGDTSERLYHEAIERLGRTRIRIAHARAQLLYGEWLRRENRRVDARTQLRAAHELFDTMGAYGFAERARRELLATGETARKRSDETRDDLTAQEMHIARLAADGRTNSEIGTQLFLSPRTVEWHLRKVYPKLGINRRRELRGALREAGLAAAA